jgi:hypothetical protein
MRDPLRHYVDAKLYLQDKYNAQVFRMGHLLECSGAMFYLYGDRLWQLVPTGYPDIPLRVELEAKF